jgi:hypothetical protein
MIRHDQLTLKSRSAPRQSAHVLPKPTRRALAVQKRGRGESKRFNSYLPPEDWYEPALDRTASFRVVVQDPGDGYVHLLNEPLIRARLSLLPPALVKPLEVVQLSRMTRKKRSFPCYGMQWGSTIYLYPLEEELIEYYPRPPQPAQHCEPRLYGGRWMQHGTSWQLEWDRESIQDFYLNNVLIHELGHLLDERNTSYRDRERYAEWFAIEYGYKPTQAARRRRLAGAGMTRHRTRR